MIGRRPAGELCEVEGSVLMDCLARLSDGKCDAVFLLVQ